MNVHLLIFCKIVWCMAVFKGIYFKLVFFYQLVAYLFSTEPSVREYQSFSCEALAPKVRGRWLLCLTKIKNTALGPVHGNQDDESFSCRRHVVSTEWWHLVQRSGRTIYWGFAPDMCACIVYMPRSGSNTSTSTWCMAIDAVEIPNARPWTKALLQVVAAWCRSMVHSTWSLHNGAAASWCQALSACALLAL